MRPTWQPPPIETFDALAEQLRADLDAVNTDGLDPTVRTFLDDMRAAVARYFADRDVESPDG